MKTCKSCMYCIPSETGLKLGRKHRYTCHVDPPKGDPTNLEDDEPACSRYKLSETDPIAKSLRLLKESMAWIEGARYCNLPRIHYRKQANKILDQYKQLVEEEDDQS